MELRKYWAPQIAKDVYVLVSAHNVDIDSEVQRAVVEYDENPKESNAVYTAIYRRYSGEEGYCIVHSSKEWAEANAKHYNLEIPTEYYKEKE